MNRRTKEISPIYIYIIDTHTSILNQQTGLAQQLSIPLKGSFSWQERFNVWVFGSVHLGGTVDLQISMCAEAKMMEALLGAGGKCAKARDVFLLKKKLSFFCF